MEQFDLEQEERVWSRVSGEQPPRLEQSIQALAAAELSEAAAHLMLSRQFQGKEKAILRKIYEEDHAHAACLKGIHFFTFDTPLAIRPIPPAPDPPVIALRKAYARKLRALRQYESRMEDPEYGAVYQLLARQEQAHCRLLLELVGNLKK
ncbi:MAG: hypothetical protein IJO72_02735 [Oscillospiraceae bacterium]|nr:hypothetical protein [Oscillospiraceae bacterium]